MLLCLRKVTAINLSLWQIFSYIDSKFEILFVHQLKSTNQKDKFSTIKFLFLFPRPIEILSDLFPKLFIWRSKVFPQSAHCVGINGCLPPTFVTFQTLTRDTCITPKTIKPFSGIEIKIIPSVERLKSKELFNSLHLRRWIRGQRRAFDH